MYSELLIRFRRVTAVVRPPNLLVLLRRLGEGCTILALLRRIFSSSSVALTSEHFHLNYKNSQSPDVKSRRN
ncbi:hypothetical protein BVRB_6g141720 [Beta vulgaris subsp. vulgaris]|uniref:Uncharacterized protein n=1 Tax=Beta vulgaris subsp. vulgaris TaxID=3555 RepID=A0A0J8C3D7_BETVV|nr:hypothetical protein BVRB_6g141720 [Beta vulgaris subsp. vulgaris]